MTDGRGFDIAQWALQSKVEKRRIAVEDISPESVGTFDYVFFLGVLYHSPDPLGYLRRVRSVCSRTLVLETHVDGLDYDARRWCSTRGRPWVTTRRTSGARTRSA